MAGDGWRLPNLKELQSIVEKRNWSPAINTTVFPNTPLADFWSASPSAPGAYNAWYVYFDLGYDSAVYKALNFAVRLVRGGQYSLLSVARAGTGSGTVTSNLPGIDCGPYCQGSFANEMFANGQIILTAEPGTDSSFDGWTSCPSANDNQCTVALDTAADTSVTANFSHTSHWTLYGFYSPVDMDGAWNIVKGGATVPLKFEVYDGTTELTDVAIVESFTAKGVTCPGDSTPADDIEFKTTGGTSLRYDAAAGQFIQNWKTPKKPGACYEVTLKTTDGSSLVAYFKLK